jgi:arabinan endo-1,5-alpha-L-arabinosidase
MKRLPLILLFLVLVCTSCNKTRLPYEDDYSASAGLKNSSLWGPYNVHDPSCKKIGEYYYTYSTDAYFGESDKNAQKLGVKLGNIQVRRSLNLVDWEFLGWALDSIPPEAIAYVRAHIGGEGATNIWAPYIVTYKDKYRLYFCVSAFGKNTSWMGLAESLAPEGPWKVIGPVLETNEKDSMNAIDPSIVIDEKTGEQWLHYGSFFDGLYCVQLNPETGLTLTPGDKGHCTVRRSEMGQNNVEAPEIVYNPELEYYYLFFSYDPLMTTYNIQVGRSLSPQGPFFDFFGSDLREPTNNFPILTAPYRFDHHAGWAGTGHCGVVENGKGNYFVLHQGRLSPENLLMDLHVREIFWSKDGWPMFSPERYAGIRTKKISTDKISGKWEIIAIKPSTYKRSTEAGQILWGENHLAAEEICTSSIYQLNDDGTVENSAQGQWKMQSKNVLSLEIGAFNVQELFVHYGYDWENKVKTLLFTGLDSNGYSSTLKLAVQDTIVINGKKSWLFSNVNSLTNSRLLNRITWKAYLPFSYKYKVSFDVTGSGSVDSYFRLASTDGSTSTATDIVGLYDAQVSSETATHTYEIPAFTANGEYNLCFSPRSAGTFVLDNVRLEINEDTGSAIRPVRVYENIGIYPNPSNGILHLTENFLGRKIQIIGFQGRIQYSSTLTSTTLNLVGLKKGLYLVRIDSNSGRFTDKLQITD